MYLRKKIFTIAILCSIAVSASAAEPFAGLRQFERQYLETQTDNDSGLLQITVDAIRPKGNRTRPYPAEGDRLVVNPPVFTWPMADYEFPQVFPTPHSDKGLDDYLKYDFQLARKADFSDATTATGLRLAMYNNHKALQPGRWYWRYRVSGGKWSDVNIVDIPESTPLFESPSIAEAMAMMPESHPVIYTKIGDDVKSPDRRALIKALRKKAEKALAKTPDDYVVKGEEIPADAPKAQRDQILKFRLRYEVEPMCSDIHSLLTVYRIDGSRDCRDKAIGLACDIARRDPAATLALSDFTGAHSMSALAEVYDVVSDHLTADQRARFEEFIMTIGRGLMARCMEENVGSADGILMAHFFQHTFSDLFNTSAVMRLHNDEAADWFAMLYDVWLSRSPGGGFLDDGVWPNGNMGYIHVNMESMVKNYVLFKRLFGVSTFSHPWYANCADALALIIPANSIGDGFGDGSDEGGMNQLRPDFAYILGTELGNPFAIAYARQVKGLTPDKPYRFSKTFFPEYRLQANLSKAETTGNYDVPDAAVFPSTGIAVMHTAPVNAANDLYLSFRSSPFGVGSHGLAEQNSFNISYGGKPLFYPTGNKITTDDRHYLLSHKHSRARNTILVDGKTQAYSHGAYGWIARFLNGDHISYAMGDASHAYIPFDISAINWRSVLEWADAYKAEEGFITSDSENPRVRKFRRHVAMLRPGIVVIYDDLEADKDVTWTFQLNGRERLNMSLDNSSLIAITDNCSARADVFSSSDTLAAALSDTCLVRPVDWLNPKRGRPAKQFEKNNYRATFENPRKRRSMRFLAVIKITPGDAAMPERVMPGADGSIEIDGFRIQAELNTARDARLEICHLGSGEILLAGPSAGAGYAAERKCSHSTVLKKSDGTLLESADRLPLMATGTPN